jgi:DNA repair exonuclease SbcCD ATPase subunit
MIKNLKLQNFMRHENLEVAFTGGLQVLRGANEGGKSSLLLGIAYALFGSKVLRGNFSDTVTWGQPESSLRVTLDLNIAGKSLRVVRHKGGAEVVVNGAPIVTGQNEVSAYIANLIGADASAASKLMLANQGNLRGALEQGPKATSQMIEDLADFDMFERLIEAMTGKLVLGNTEAIEKQVAEAEAALAATPEVSSPDFAPIDFEIASLSAGIGDAEQAAKVEFDKLGKADEALAAARAAVSVVAEVRTQMVQSADKVKALLAREKDLTTERVCAFSADDRTTVANNLTAAKYWQADRNLYEQYLALTYPKLSWDMPEADFKAEYKTLSTSLDKARADRADLETQIRVLESSLVTSAFCGYCGEDFSKLPEVASKNAATMASVTTKKLLATTADDLVISLQRDVQTMDRMNSLAREYSLAAAKLGDKVSLESSTWPPTATWIAEIPPETGPNAADLAGKLSRIDAAIKTSEAAASKLLVVLDQIEDERGVAKRLLERLESLPQPSVAEAEAAREAAHTVWTTAYQAYSTSSVRLQDLRSQRERMSSEYETALTTRVKLASDWSEKRTVLEDMRFNNALLKKVRAARPVISDKLWNTVLASVSTAFSRLRGEPSIVTKSKDGFTVNGKAVELLSGSTLDLLGLAIRTSLVKTFIPHCPFLVLDEPSAACDIDRTTTMLGFIHAIGFDQVILVTHDPVAETVADNLIQL